MSEAIKEEIKNIIDEFNECVEDGDFDTAGFFLDKIGTELNKLESSDRED